MYRSRAPVPRIRSPTPRRPAARIAERMTPRDGNRRRVLSYEERVLWSAVTQSIAPLRENAPPPAEPEPEPSPPRPVARKVMTTAAPPPPTPSGPPPLAPLDRRAKKRVARGHQPIEARFDLHGYTQDQAH